MLSIRLNSFVHRVEDKAIVINLANQTGCHLKRIRRSRHWQLSGEESQLRQLIGQLENVGHQWIVKAIEKALPQPEIDLLQILTINPSMTVSQLVVETGCSMSEARRAIDQYEDL
ncbi:ribosome recycling factor family protein [Vibrio brasiliensis]|jgi:hypothetical protein|uniref:ribosome recycling factor family protein n=1 Tax=Vibrio brasiliensis TaxID=170652 RepID=UPI001EFC53BD|nr:ribosome recycling factor family protein [Vibrio brasiliensis]MCG9749227.1 ribosome recycling factor family protein [Vibrio brasiliensis]MCG9782371.1 ribosome recycling factor family protein [Vibrio brasiliensis]